MTLGLAQVVFLFVVAVLTAGISSVAALGGGLVLFAVMAAVLDYAVLIPMYGAIQGTSSVARTWLFRRHMDLRLVAVFMATFVPSAALGALIWLFVVQTEAAQPYVKMVIAAYVVLFAVVRPFRLRAGSPVRLCALGGAVSGVVSMTVGAVGAVLAPFFVALGLRKEPFVALFAGASLVANLTKLPLFLFVPGELGLFHLAVVVAMAAASFLGAYLGRAIIGRIDERVFHAVFTVVLSAVAAKLFLWDGLRPLLGG